MLNTLQALMSLLFLAISRASLLDMVVCLHSILSMSTKADTLTGEITEETGIFLRSDIVKTLQRFEVLIQEQVARHKSPDKRLDSPLFDPEKLLNQPEYHLPVVAKKVVRIGYNEKQTNKQTTNEIHCPDR